jgi:hypothetical protein
MRNSPPTPHFCRLLLLRSEPFCPVFDGQSIDSPEFIHVVRNQRHVHVTRMCGNHRQDGAKMSDLSRLSDSSGPWETLYVDWGL